MYLIANTEFVIFAVGLMRFSEDFFDPGAARPACFQPGDQLLNVIRLTTGNHFDTAVIQIARVTRQPEL
ncbi:hypothetical protein D1872_320750 [compost metagenome]